EPGVCAAYARVIDADHHAELRAALARRHRFAVAAAAARQHGGAKHGRDQNIESLHRLSPRVVLVVYVAGAKTRDRRPIRTSEISETPLGLCRWRPQWIRRPLS